MPKQVAWDSNLVQVFDDPTLQTQPSPPPGLDATENDDDSNSFSYHDLLSPSAAPTAAVTSAGASGTTATTTIPPTTPTGRAFEQQQLDQQPVASLPQQLQEAPSDDSEESMNIFHDAFTTTASLQAENMMMTTATAATAATATIPTGATEINTTAATITDNNMMPGSSSNMMMMNHDNAAGTNFFDCYDDEGSMMSDPFNNSITINNMYVCVCVFLSLFCFVVCLLVLYYHDTFTKLI